MIHRLSWAAGFIVSLTLGVGALVSQPLAARAEAPAAASRVAMVQDAKDAAIRALVDGDVARGRRLVEDAAGRAGDVGLRTIAGWMGDFEGQFARTLEERRAEYDKSVAQVNLLLGKGKLAYAADAATRAYTLALDKRAFANETWVAALIRDVQAAAYGAGKGGDWLLSERLYLDLSAIEPSNPAWKEQLKRTAHVVRLQALYAPDMLRDGRKARMAEDVEVEHLLAAAQLAPTTQPGKTSATQPAMDEESADVKINWHDVLKDIRYDMLWTAIADTYDNYYRDLDYAKLMTGGLRSLREVATTGGLEKTFPLLADATKKQQFLTAIDDALARVRETRGDDEGSFRRLLAQVRAANGVTLDLPEEVFVNEFVDGALGELDPFSTMIWPSAAEEFNSMTEGEFAGVGIRIERDETRSLRVISPMEDSPAYDAGIKAGDLILRVNGESVQDLLLEQAVKKIKGPPGTTVTLTIRTSEGATRDFALKRATIKVASVTGWMRRGDGAWDYMIDPAQHVGYMRLSSFARQSSQEMEAALAQMEKAGARGVILDLRSDGGGLLTAAIEIADKFLKSGVVVSTHADRTTPQQPTVASAQADRNECELPLVILVNQFSASASEILSGALKDHHRALIVGERTFGKGSVQMLFQIGGHNAALKLTTSHYYLPSGRCVHREEDSTTWGVDPDVVVEMTPEQMRTVIDLRQELDVLRRRSEAGKALPATRPAKQPADLLAADPQLSGALLLMRLELAGGRLIEPAPAQARAQIPTAGADAVNAK